MGKKFSRLKIVWPVLVLVIFEIFLWINNVDSSTFNSKDNPFFYEECAKQVIEFCKKYNIKYHIKFGTSSESSKNTASLFKKVCTPPMTV